MVLVHGRAGAHPVEQLVLLSISGDHVSSALVVTSKHTSKHHKVSTSSKCLGYITRACTTTILEGGRDVELIINVKVYMSSTVDCAHFKRVRA